MWPMGLLFQAMLIILKFKVNYKILEVPKCGKMRDYKDTIIILKNNDKSGHPYLKLVLAYTDLSS